LPTFSRSTSPVRLAPSCSGSMKDQLRDVLAHAANKLAEAGLIEPVARDPPTMLIDGSSLEKRAVSCVETRRREVRPILAGCLEL
jgi:hypothetical protein